jgi:hypothetical protein
MIEKKVEGWRYNMPQSKDKRPSRKKKPQKYDTSFKALVEEQAPDILPLFLPGAVYEKTLNVEIVRSTMRADKVFKILYSGEEHILHLEFETGSDGELCSRLLVYNSVLYRDYKIPVITIVIYPFPVQQAVSPLCIKSHGKEILSFHFRTLPLFTMDAEQFVQEHRACMYPLLPTMNGVHAEPIAQVMQELTNLYRDNKTSLSQQFTWMEIFLERTGTITPLEKDRIEERLKMFDQLWNESPRVQKMKKQFREEAQKEAKQQAEQERQRLQQEAEQEIAKQVQERLRSQQKIERVMTDQEVKVRRSSLVSVTRARFPNLTDFAQQHVELFDKPEVLDLLIQQVAVAPDANIVRLLLSPGSAP